MPPKALALLRCRGQPGQCGGGPRKALLERWGLGREMLAARILARCLVPGLGTKHVAQVVRRPERKTELPWSTGVGGVGRKVFLL